MSSMSKKSRSNDGRSSRIPVSKPTPSSGLDATDVKQDDIPIAIPKASASVILISPTNKVLLLRRVSTSTTFPSAHVFPGGLLEPSDGEVCSRSTDPARHRDSIAYRTAAIRELFEESGILLARQSPVSAKLLTLPLEVRNKGRREVYGNKIHISSWLAQSSPSAVLDTKSLQPFTRWVSPVTMPKRFTTQLYLYFLPTSIDEFLAVSDDIEMIAAEWSFANDWLERARKGQIILHATQCMLLYLVGKFLQQETLSKTKHISELEDQRHRLRAFIDGGQPPWAQKVISPKAINSTRKDGRTVLGLDWPGPELDDVEGVEGDKDHVILARYVNNVPRNIEVALKVPMNISKL